MKLTRQGVRDLGGNERRRPRRAQPIPHGALCPHRRMRDHCDGGCGHIECDGCSLFIDIAFELGRFGARTVANA